jgi:hypothetical protein
MEQKLRLMFERLLSELPPETAALRMRRTTKNDGAVFELIPSNDRAATIFVHAEDNFDLVDFSFGDSGTWELPSEGRNPNTGADGTLLEVEDMCRAVMAGNCVCQQGWLLSGSRIFVDGFVYAVRYIRFSRKARTRTYVRYF